MSCKRRYEMSSKKRSKNKRFHRDLKIRKRKCVVQTKRNPKNAKKWKARTGHAVRMLQREKYFRAKELM